MNIRHWSISIGVFILLIVGMGVSIRWVAAGNEAAAPFGGVTAYATVGHVEGNLFLEMDITNPESRTSTETYYFYTGIDFANDVFTTAYALDGYDNMLVALDISTVAESVIGAATPIAGEKWMGMTWDRTTNTMYAVAATDCTAQPTFSLYTLNLSTGAATRINTESRPGCVFDIAAHPVTGVLYAVSLFPDTTMPDRIIAIDKTTTDISLVVELGFDARPTGHGMDFDDSTGVLYYAYSEGYECCGAQAVYAVNVQGGPLETIYQSPQGKLMDDFVIARAAAPLPVISADPMSLSEVHKTPPDITTRTLTIQNTGTAPLTWSLFEDGGAGLCLAPHQLEWLSTDVTNGTIPVGGSTDIEVTFDSIGLGPIGTVFYASLCLESNDQSAPVVPVRIEFRVGYPTAVTLNTLNTTPAMPWLSFGVVGIVALTGIVIWRRRR